MSKPPKDYNNPQEHDFDPALEPDPSSYSAWADALSASGVIGLPLDANLDTLLEKIIVGMGHSLERDRNIVDSVLAELREDNPPSAYFRSRVSHLQHVLGESVADTMLVALYRQPYHGVVTQQNYVVLSQQAINALLYTACVLAFAGWQASRSIFEADFADMPSAILLLKQAAMNVITEGATVANLQALHVALNASRLWDEPDDDEEDYDEDDEDLPF